MEGASNPLQEGLALLKAGNAAGALAPLAAALKADPNSFPACLALGLALMQCKRLDQAAAALGRASKLNPGHALCHYQLGVVQEQRGDLAAAKAAWQAALQCDPALDKARQALARVSGNVAATVQAAPAAAPPAAPAQPAPPPPQPSPQAPQPAAAPQSAVAAKPGHMRSLGDDDEMIAPLGGTQAPAVAAPQAAAPRSAEPIANFMPPTSPAQAETQATKVLGRINSVQSQGKGGVMEYWDVLCTAERAYFVKVAGGVPLILLAVIGIALGALIYSTIGRDTGRIADTYRNYALAGAGGMLAFVGLQALLMSLMASGKRIQLDKLPPAKAADETGGFSMDWGTLRGMRMSKTGVTIYNSQMKKTFGFGKRMAELDKFMKGQNKAKTAVPAR